MSIRLLAVHQGGGIGGAPVSLLKLLSALDPTEFSPHSVFTESGSVLDYARNLGVPASHVPTGGALFYSAHARPGPRAIAGFVRSFPSSVQTARRVLRQHRPDLVHLNTSVLLAWAAATRRERMPVVWVVREVLGPNPVLRRWQANYIVRHARRVVAISDAVTACFAVPVDRVHNAVDLAEFRLDLVDHAPTVRAELGIPPGHHVVMVVGAVQRPKGHWLLLEAISRLPETTHLVVVAGGVPPAYGKSLRGRVKQALNVPLDNLDALLRDARRLGLDKRVHVTGFRTDIARLLTATDVLAFPSLQPEGFGRPIIEAMALARPVVATDVGPSAEILGTEAGRLVAPDAAHLARELQDLLDAPDERTRLGRAGRARVEACFGLDRQVAQMSAIYREAARSV